VAPTAIRQASPGKDFSGQSLAALRETARREGDGERARLLWEEIRARAPRDTEAIGHLALLAAGRGELKEAERGWKEALEIAPRNAGLWGNLAEVYRLQRRLSLAEEAIREARRLNPTKADVRHALAIILWDQRKIGEALEVCAGITEGGVVGAGVANLEGNIASHLGEGAVARAKFARALALRPGFPQYVSNHLLSLLYDEALSPAEVFDAHEAAGALLDSGRTLPLRDPDPTRPLRLAFLSPDFRFHSVAFFLGPLLDAIDRERFEVRLYSLVAQPDSMTEALASRARALVPVLGMSPGQLAARCAADGIDILIELAGHTGDNGLPRIGQRVAPIQLSWLGYPHSTGLRALDGRLTDAVIEPLPEAQALSTERVWHIPQGAHVYRLPGSEVPLTPLPMLGRGHPTFICCNNSAKISPSTVRLWARLLRAVPEARLVLKNSGYTYPPRARAILADFAAEGVESARIELRPMTPSIREHVETYQEADLALDTFPYNGTTTTCEALWMGVPVVTLRGTTARARHSESLLRQVGLDDWVCDDEAGFINRVRSALADPEGLARLRGGLRDRLRLSPLGHPVSFAGRFQATLRRLWTTHCAAAGAAPVDVDRGHAAADRDEATGATALALSRAQWHDERGETAASAGEWEKVARSGLLPQAWLEWARRREILGDPAGALEAWRAATAARPDEAALWAGRAEAARECDGLEEASEAYAKVLALAPGNPGVWMNHSAVLRALGRPVAAEEAARRALALQADFPEAWNNLGGALRDQARFDEAVEAYCSGLHHRPDDPHLHSNLVYLLNFIPGLGPDELASQHAVFDENQLGALSAPPRRAFRRPLARGPRLGFLSSDLREHSVGRFLRAALPALRERGAELHLFADHARPDAFSRELRQLASRWSWVGGSEDDALGELLRGAELDVLLELNGHTAGHRLPLLARRLAPLQGSWLGYPTAPGTRGLDFFLSDRHIHPGEETPPGILRLPDCCLPWELPAALPALGPAPEGGITFGAFHAFPKLNDAVWEIWISLLRALPGSRLLLKSRPLGEAAARAAWEARLRAAGAPLERITILPYAATEAEHLAAYAMVDLALDPSPYNGVTTTMEALSMGVPVLTIPGETPASRHAASLLHTYRGGEGVCAEADALEAFVRRTADELPAFRAGRRQRQEAFRIAAAAHRQRWAGQFLSALETALASNP
jgi:predicted O-linked N-acetylglucosamine transferase (SPINDLY family)